jgi:galactonate dehydratase
MKITRISTRIMGVPGPGGPHAPRRNWVFVFVDTDAGISGIGEATSEWHEQAVAQMIEQHMGPVLVGRDPTRIEQAWQFLQRNFWWRNGIVAASAMSGIDQALWDITGKAYKLPVYKLLGGAVRERVRLYARMDLGLPSVPDEARAAVEEGFDAFKFGYGRPCEPFDDMAQVQRALDEGRRVRQAAGPNVDLMIDCGGLFSQQAAMALLAGLRPMNMLFVEEPVNADTPRSLVELRRANLDMRIAAGERLSTRWGFREWLEVGAVDVIQADISHCGGISELLKIAHGAEVYNVRVAPHNPYGPVALAAAAHACAAMSNFLILEHCRLRPWFDQVQKSGPTIRKGCVELDDRPGLGVELNGDVIERHPYLPMPLRTYQDKWGGMPLI